MFLKFYFVFLPSSKPLHQEMCSLNIRREPVRLVRSLVRCGECRDSQQDKKDAGGVPQVPSMALGVVGAGSGSRARLEGGVKMRWAPGASGRVRDGP